MKTWKKWIASVLFLTIILTMVGCGKTEVALEPLVFYGENGEVVTPTEGIDYAIVLMVTINPEALFYVDANKNVLKIEAMNSDCEAVLANMTCKTGGFTDCYGDFLEICYRQGYLKAGDKQEVKLTVVAKEASTSEAVALDIVANAEELVGGIGEIYGMDLYATKDTRVLEPNETPMQVANSTDQNPEDMSNQEDVSNQEDMSNQEAHDNQEESDVCDMCNGVGVITCESCNGTKSEIVMEHYTKEVRNDYVCPVCGGKGWVDDGMHGGLTAECGHCTTNGGNGEFKALAYDQIEVDEEVARPCHQCGGTGQYICNRCDGSGKR